MPAKKALLSRYFRTEDIVAKDDQLEQKPSPKGLRTLKERLGVSDWEMLYVGDGHDDYSAASGANCFFSLIAQGLIKDTETIRAMKTDSEFGADFLKDGTKKLPKFIVMFTYDELLWWLKDNPQFLKRLKAVCFDLGDTLIIGGRAEAYSLTDKAWPTWEVDNLIQERKVDKKLKKAIVSLRIADRWRRLSDLPSMNSSEARITSFFMLELFSLSEKNLASALYSEMTKEIKALAMDIAESAGIALASAAITPDARVRDLAEILDARQFAVVLGAALTETVKQTGKNAPPKEDEMATAILAASIWLADYRKHETEAYRRHCKIPRGLPELLEFLKKKKKRLCIYTSKSRSVVETALAYEKDVEQ